MKLSPKAKSEVISYLRSVGVATVTVVVAIVIEMHPAYAVLIGSVVAPLVKAIDPTYKGHIEK
jgi:hypothetical protein